MAALGFKCCKSKECSSMCCIQCFGIFHLSCMKRKSTVTYLDGQKIICSRECERRRGEDENNASKLTQQLEGLTRQLRERDELIIKLESAEEERVAELCAEVDKLTTMDAEKAAFIKKMEIRAKDFEDEVYNTEQSYMREIDGLKSKVSYLGKEVIEFVRRNEALQGECDGLAAELNKLGLQIGECNRLKENMLTSIETLTEENHFYIGELKRLKCGNDKLGCGKEIEEQLKDSEDDGKVCQVLKDDPPVCPQISHLNVVERMAEVDPTPQSCKLSRVLILCDDFGRGMSTLLRKHLKHDLTKYSIETLIKPGATTDRIVESVDQLTRNYCFNDYVVVIAGTNDFRGKKYPQLKVLVDKVKKCCDHTNMILVSVPYISEELASRVYRFNCKLREIVYRLDQCMEGTVRYVDLNFVKPVLSNKEIACGEIVRCITSSFHLYKNLIFIRANKSVGSPDESTTVESCRKQSNFQPIVVSLDST